MLVPVETQIETTMKYQPTSVQMSTIKSMKEKASGESMWKVRNRHTLLRGTIRITIVGNNMDVSEKK